MFEDLVVDLVGVEYQGTGSIVARPGDWGIDAFVGQLTQGGCIQVWQAKYFPDKIGDSQKQQIRLAYQQARKAADEHGYRVDAWTLCVPCTLDGPAMAWWNRWRGKQHHGVTIDLWAENDLRAKLLAPQGAWIYDHYLGDGATPSGARHTVTRLGRVGDGGDYGIRPSVLRATDGSQPHFQRDIDDRLRECFRRALASPGVTVIAIDGEPLAGKSHAAARALVETASGCPLFTAATGPELRAVLRAGVDEPAVVWLDPAESVFDPVGGGMVPAELSEGGRVHSALLVVAITSADGDDGLLALRRCCDVDPITVDLRLRSHELTAAKRQTANVDDGLWDEIDRWGLGPALTASPNVLRAYRRGADPDGRALVEIILSWRAAGMRQPLEEGILLDLHQLISVGGRGPRAGDAALAWASSARAPGQAMLRRHGSGWNVHPALEQLPPPERWKERWSQPGVLAILEHWSGEDPGRLASAGIAAARLGEPDRARSLLDRGIGRGSLRARFNLARLHVDEGQHDQARQTLEDLRRELLDRGVGPDRPELEALLASTWFALGMLPGARDRELSLEALEEAAALGHVQALANLASLQRGTEHEEALVRRLEVAAHSGSADASFAFLLQDGRADNPPVEASLRALEGMLASMRAAEAERLGGLLLHHGLVDLAHCALSAASAAGRLPATAQLGGLLLDAGSPNAAAVLRDAAERGSRAAMLYLGRALRDSSPVEARDWLQRAHDLGSPTAGIELLALLLAAGSDDAGTQARVSDLLVELDEGILLAHRHLLGATQLEAVARRWSSAPRVGSRARGEGHV